MSVHQTCRSKTRGRKVGEGWSSVTATLFFWYFCDTDFLPNYFTVTSLAFTTWISDTRVSLDSTAADTSSMPLWGGGGVEGPLSLCARVRQERLCTETKKSGGKSLSVSDSCAELDLFNAEVKFDITFAVGLWHCWCFYGSQCPAKGEGVILYVHLFLWRYPYKEVLLDL